ncbi:PQQ-dependent sugar dehydrogenase [Rubricoccus marinus]|uniref:Glucose/Sorbosone dehydrogenase domain-containing protein n=1 Tax=Rubricoccus marinus TaxID=716817 RepID=A0A259U2Q5_9BACT|nr:PQQ-dependent sugar dehydrogenase [Rubricoccus marinus]OZC04333.1 hypothetical protein BSZ36_15925 [Rubricoccus marinus]
MIRSALALCFLLLAAPMCAQTLPGQSADEVATDAGNVEVLDVTGGLVHPWGMAFLPDGRLLVTERAGRLRIVDTEGNVSPEVPGGPKAYVQGQGGYLDVALDPDFAANQHVWLSYSRPGPGSSSATALGRATMQGDSLTNWEVMFTQTPWFSNGLHFGGRIGFSPEGHVFLTLGERFQFDPAQDLTNHMGAVVRLNRDGSVPEDNPFVGREDALPEIYSYGHRNVQSIAFDPASGDIWEAEYGPLGGDELNLLTPGTNYGWPVVSWGDNYDGSQIPDPDGEAQFTDAVKQWTPVISPSGMIFYTGDVFPEWTGSLVISSLSRQGLVRLNLENGAVANEEIIPLGARIRDVEQGPDGHLYVLTDDRDGHVWRLSPLTAE